MLCTQADDAVVFAAARGAGKLLVLDALTGELRNEIAVGPKPNGLAWNPVRGQLLVADVEDYLARIVEPLSGRTLETIQLPGRPRWAVYDAARERFLVNVREPPCVVALASSTPVIIDVSAAGPHGLDIDAERSRAFVACDAGTLAVIDLETDQERAAIPIDGEPDAIWFNPKRNELYVAIGSPGLVDVVDCERMQVAQRVETERGAHTTAFDARRQLLYVFLPQSCRAAVYDVGAHG